MEGFEESIGGKWILLRNEGFDEYLAAMGIGYIKRKIACAVTTKMEILKVGDKRVRIITKGPKDMDTQINMDEEVDEVDPFDNKIKMYKAGNQATDGLCWLSDSPIIQLDNEFTSLLRPIFRVLKVKVTWDPVLKIMRTESNPAEGSAAKKSIVERKIVDNGELLMEVTMPNENIVCKRYFKKDDS